MKSPRDPDEVEQTLLPDAPAKPTPANSTDTPPHPAASDATLPPPSTPAPDETLARPSTPAAAPADAGATLPSIMRSLPSADTNNGYEATLLPSSTGTGGAPGTIVDTPVGDAGATLPTPTSRTIASGGGAARPAGDDTAALSESPAPAGPRLGSSPSATGTMVGRFALRGLHASGGLGEVFTARDTELNREVAVKRIKSQYADDPGSRSRFLTEAELTARLDHPGVVPVFGLVNDVRGRPCYAMRFIRGETLKDEIERYHGSQGSGAKGQGSEKTEKTGEKKSEAPGLAAAPPGSNASVPRSVAFRHLLARFIATCQAIAYAHSRNIIHRDIKPANIMVGTFGETLVVDWGLAKSLDDGPDLARVMKAQAETGFRRDPEATDMPSHMTMAGTAVGTPAYMAPEQAAGEVDKVGIRADIYALGATLFVILTGKAPFSGKTTAEVLDRVRRGTYDPATTVNPEAPKPLDAIARKAMALRQEDRYATALELAADVERWLSDEPVSCYRDPFFARLARWGRRHPARVAAGVSLLLAGVLAAGGVAWAVHLGEQKTAAERDNVILEQAKTEAALEQVKKEQKKTAAELVAKEAARAEAQRQEALAKALSDERTADYEGAVQSYNVLINDIDAGMADQVDLQDERKRFLRKAIGGLQKLVQDKAVGGGNRAIVAAYRQLGEVQQLVGETASARRSFEKAVEEATKVQNAEKNGTDVRRNADRDLGRSLAGLADIHRQAGETKKALDAIDEAIKLLTPRADEKLDPDTQKALTRAKLLRAAILTDRGETGAAVKDIDAVLADRQKLAAAAPDDLGRKRDLAAGFDALAGVQLRTGGTGTALVNAQKSLGARSEVAAKLPKQPDVRRELAAAHARLGEVYFERAQMTAAIKEFRAGLEVLKKLAAEDKKSVSAKADLAAMYGRLGHTQIRTGDVEEAVANTKAGKEIAVELYEADKGSPEAKADLAEADTGSAKAKRDLALARERYGDALLALRQTDAGLAEYEESAKILRQLREADKDSAAARLDLARALERFGDGRVAKQDMPGAVTAFADSVALRREVAGKDKDSASAKRDLAVGLYKLAGAQCDGGKSGEADASATEATDLFVKLAAADPDSAQAKRDIALAYGKWGQILNTGGHSTGALIVWQSSLDRCEDLAKVDAGNTQAKEDEAEAWERLANFYVKIGNTDRALVAANTAVKLWEAIANGTDVRTKAGRQRLALAMLRCGEINIEMRKWDAVRATNEQVVKVVGADAADPLLGPVAKLAAQQQLHADAVEIGLKNPEAVLKLDKDVQVAALRTIVTIELRAGYPANVGAAARVLAKVATTPADKFAVARAFAGCVASPKGTPEAKDRDAAEAVQNLKLAIAADFKDANALTGPEWDAVGKRAPEFAKMLAEVEKRKGGK